tara:strand:- start:8573 stop:10150 length:1578 start_codon:yes stop_codon:yes gene_type:complete
MFKLTIISGPQVGITYPLEFGENTVGRQQGNTIVLESKSVSKKHCVLTIDHGKILLQDLGSSNGTYVNGSLTGSRWIQSGDRITLGEYILEVRDAHLVSTDGQLPTVDSMMSNQIKSKVRSELNVDTPAQLKDRIVWFFEHYLMPVFYKMNTKHEWKFVLAGLFSVFLVISMFISLGPLLSYNRRSILREIMIRASYLSEEIAERNSRYIASRQEGKTEIGSAARGAGVKVALITDLENRIIAPANRVNQYLTRGEVATFVVKTARQFKKGRENGVVRPIGISTVVAIHPIKILDSRLGKNVVAGMAIVAVDSSLSTLNWGALGLIYSETLILVSLIGVLVFLIFYRLTLKRFEVLSDELDLALKGEKSRVTQEFKLEELNRLWESINSTIQRIPQDDGSGLGVSGFTGPAGEEFVLPIQMFGELTEYGVVLFNEEKHILHVNSHFENMSGIHSMEANGQLISNVARDQALSMMVEDLLNQVDAMGGQPVQDDFEFGGEFYKFHVSGFGKIGVQSYLLIAVKEEG